MNANTAVAIINVALISLAGFGIYVTHEWWPLLVLFFRMNVKDDKEK